MAKHLPPALGVLAAETGMLIFHGRTGLHWFRRYAADSELRARVIRGRGRLEFSPPSQAQLQTLRRLLRRYPFWARGHLLLGYLSFVLDDSSAADRNELFEQEQVRTVNVEASALLALRETAKRERSEALEIQANALLGLAAFKEGKHGLALQLLVDTLRRRKSEQALAGRLLVSVVETAAFAASSAGSSDVAKALLSGLPSDVLSSEAKTLSQALTCGEATK